MKRIPLLCQENGSRKVSLYLAAFVQLLGTAHALGQCNPSEIAKLIASDAAANDQLTATAISNDTMIIGALNDVNGGVNTGSAYVFVRSGGVWTQQAKLLAADGAASDFFGWAVSIEENTAVVGAYGDDHSGAPNKGSVYVYTRTGTTWTQVAKLIAAENTTAFACFGRSVKLRGDTLLIGAFGDSYAAGETAGSAFLFRRDGGNWIYQYKFTAPDAAAGDYFGLEVCISGDTALIGAPFDDHGTLTDAGSVYVFIRTGNTWVFQSKLIANDAAVDDLFGYNVALSGDVALVGRWSDGTGTGPGSAYVFRRSGVVWTQEARLVPSDGAAGDSFGVDVDISGDYALVGSYLDDHAGIPDAGSAYLYRYSGGAWNEIAKLTAVDAAASDQFGRIVNLHGDMAIVSARFDDHPGAVDAGSVYLYDLGCVENCCTGDFDDNNIINAADIAGMVDSVLSGSLCIGMPVCCIGDLNDDGTVTGADISGFVNKLTSGGTCD